ncbi:MAG: glycoside hydrolase family 3 C-terminal domain-containing protein [Chthonomonadales bacterium]
MTLEEKVSQMMHDAPPIPRLSIPAYNWWNECLHGVARAGIATVFPQAIGLAAGFDEQLVARVAEAISDEARAKHHQACKDHGGASPQYFGLTFWSPNINIFRDPRWGRGQETYGEDPYLTARLGVAFVRGLQGDHPKYFKTIATPKHFAVHSGPEKDRHSFDARVNPRDLWETYLPAFKACVQEGKAGSVMAAYNRTNGEPCCASKTLLQDILRDEWGFTGYVVSDCGAIDDIFRNHRVVLTAEQAAALAVANGCDLNCGDTYKALIGAILNGLLDETAINRAVERLFEARIRLGMFDPPESVPYASIPISVNDSEEHRALALQAARASIVLLKNDRSVLPFGSGIRNIAVIGPNADDVDVLLGNYHGTPSRAVTILQGILHRAGNHVTVRHAKGCDLVGGHRGGFAEAEAAARSSDVVVMVMGLSPKLEGEEGEEGLLDKSGDRRDLGLPPIQMELLHAIHSVGTPIVLVTLSGSALALGWAAQNVAAMMHVWYGGEEAGTAVAEALFGDFNPAGRLPVTFYQTSEQLPPFTDYSMIGRTYRYFHGHPLFPFGYGLSYTTFEYSGLTITPATIAPGESVQVRVTVRNTGGRPGDEVVQLYLAHPEASVPVPIRSLQGFRRIHLVPGEDRTLEFALDPRQMVCWSDEGTPFIEPGRLLISVGGGQPSAAASGRSVLTGSFEVRGARVNLSRREV